MTLLHEGKVCLAALKPVIEVLGKKIVISYLVP